MLAECASDKPGADERPDRTPPPYETERELARVVLRLREQLAGEKSYIAQLESFLTDEQIYAAQMEMPGHRLMDEEVYASPVFSAPESCPAHANFERRTMHEDTPGPAEAYPPEVVVAAIQLAMVGAASPETALEVIGGLIERSLGPDLSRSGEPTRLLVSVLKEKQATYSVNQVEA